MPKTGTGDEMLWQLFTEKPTQRRMHLVCLLEKKAVPLAELARCVDYSSKTLQRDLIFLQQTYQLQFQIGDRIVWQDKEKYPTLYQQLLHDSPRFCLFEQFLWGKEKAAHSKIRQPLQELNRFFKPLGIWLDTKAGCLAGNQRVIFQLRLQYVKDFTSCKTSEQRYEYFLAQRAPVYFAEKYLKQVAGDPCFFRFLNECAFTMRQRIGFYQDHQLQAVANNQLLAQHQKSASPCYQKVVRLMAVLKRYFTFSHQQQAACQRMCFKLLLAVETELPLAYVRLAVYRSQTRAPRFTKQLSQELQQLRLVVQSENELFQAILFDLIEKILPHAFSEKSWRVGLALKSSATEQARNQQQLQHAFGLVGKIEIILFKAGEPLPPRLDVAIIEDHYETPPAAIPIFHFKDISLAELFIFLWQLIQEQDIFCLPRICYNE